MPCQTSPQPPSVLSPISRARLTCRPAAGTAPFGTTMTVRLDNFHTGQSRRAAARIDIALAGGGAIGNWRTGWTNMGAGGHFQTAWVQTIPALSALAGVNAFTLTAVDVTPSAQRLLAFIALSPRGVDRAFLAFQLWPEHSEQRAKANLRSALWRLGNA